MSTRLRTVAVSALAVALFAWFLRGADLSSVLQEIRRARLGFVLLSFLPLAVAYVGRTVRWQYLLEPLGPTRFAIVFRATVIGFAATALLPARLGDLLRPYLVARREQLRVASAVATIVMERVLDLVMVLVLLALYVWLLGGGEALPARLLGPIKVSAAIAAAASLALFALMWTLATHPERIAELVRRSERVLPSRIAHRLSSLSQTFSQGFAVAREVRALSLATAWSLPVWLGIAAHAWLITLAFGIALPFTGTFLLQALLVIGVAVPTPGAVGGYHAMYRFGVTQFFGASNEAAIGAAILAHATSFVPVVILGFVFMVQDGLSLMGLQHVAEEARTQGK